MEYLSSMPFPNKVYFSQNDLKVFGLLNIVYENQTLGTINDKIIKKKLEK